MEWIPETALVGPEAEGGGGDPPAAARVVKLSATAMSRGSYVVALLDERYTVTMLPAEQAWIMDGKGGFHC